jgi:TatD DNase family protein
MPAERLMLVDSHCHLDFPDFADDLDAIVERAIDAGVSHMLTICTHPERVAATRNIVQRFPSVYGAVGVHPHESGSPGAGSLSEQTLIDLAQHPKIVGIGETGLDFHYDFAPRGFGGSSGARIGHAARDDCGNRSRTRG